MGKTTAMSASFPNYPFPENMSTLYGRSGDGNGTRAIVRLALEPYERASQTAKERGPSVRQLQIEEDKM